MEVHATPSPLNTRHRIHNRPTDKTEVRLLQAEEAMRKILRRLRRSDREQYAIMLKWRDCSRIMLQTHPCMTTRRRKRALALWYSMGFFLSPAKILIVGNPWIPNLPPSSLCASTSAAPTFTIPFRAFAAFFHSGVSCWQWPHLESEGMVCPNTRGGLSEAGSREYR